MLHDSFGFEKKKKTNTIQNTEQRWWKMKRKQRDRVTRTLTVPPMSKIMNKVFVYILKV